MEQKRKINGIKKRRTKMVLKPGAKAVLGVMAIGTLFGIVIPKLDFSKEHRVPEKLGQAREVYVLPNNSKNKLCHGYATIDGKQLELDEEGYSVFTINTEDDNGVNLNLREEPTTESDKIGELKSGEYVLAKNETVYGQYIQWRQVYNINKGEIYYVSEKYLENPQTLSKFFEANRLEDTLYILDGKKIEDVRDDEFYLCEDVDGKEHSIPANVFEQDYMVLSEKQLSDYYLTTLIGNENCPAQVYEKDENGELVLKDLNGKQDGIQAELPEGYQILVAESADYEGFAETVNGTYIPISYLNWETKEPINFDGKEEKVTKEIPKANEELLKEHLCSDKYNIAYSQTNGGVQGIDINCNDSTCTPEQLRYLLETNRNIQYVVLKLGATGFGEKFSFANSENSRVSADAFEYVKVCNELKIPYGFYYYSTSKTETEALQEADHIEALYKNLDVCEDLELIPFTIDVEWGSSDNDRRKDSSVKDLTNAQIIVYKALQQKGIISDKAMYYAPRKSSALNGDEKLTDYPKLSKALKGLGVDLYAWIADPSKALAEGKHRKYYGKDTMIPMVQTKLDYKRVDKGDLSNEMRYDVNFMNVNFANYLGIRDRSKAIEDYKNEGWEIGDND